LHDLAVPVAEQGINNFGKVGESFLGKGRVGADPDDLSVLGLKKSVMVRTGRLQVFNSGRAEIEHIEIDQNVFAYQTTESL